jgi:hypothetical protein
MARGSLLSGAVPRAVPRALSGIGGALMLLAVAGLAVAGTRPDLILNRLPGLAVDAAAVGGAAAALSMGVLVLGLAHVLLALALVGGAPWAPIAGIGFGAMISALLFALAAAAFVELADGSGLVALAGGIGLVLTALGYLMLTVVLIGLRRAAIGRPEASGDS